MLFSPTVATGRILPTGQTSSSHNNNNNNSSSSGMGQGHINPLIGEVSSPFMYKGGSSSDLPRIKPPQPVSQPPSYRPPVPNDIFETGMNNSNSSSNNRVFNDDNSKSGKGNGIGKSYSYEGSRRDLGSI